MMNIQHSISNDQVRKSIPPHSILSVGYWIFLFLLIFPKTKLYPQVTEKETPDYYKEKRLKNEDAVYVPYIKTVQLYFQDGKITEIFNPPFILRNSEKKLVLEFDDMEAGYKNYQVKIYHCEHNWTNSILSESEYLNEYNLFHVLDFEYSFNTSVQYTHYKFEVPPVLVSGNFIVRVFFDNDEDNFVLTRRFIVYEKDLIIHIKLHPSSDVSQRYSMHEIDFTLTIDPVKVRNPIEEINVVLMQNQRWDNAIRGLKPVFIRENELIYDYDGENNFPAGNEFRNFDFRNLRFLTLFVDSIKTGDERNDIWLKPEEPRKTRPFSNEKDINGSYAIQRDNSLDHSKEADYAYVHFTLKVYDKIDKGDVYVFGKLSDWNLNNDFRMTYNEEKKMYELSALLKQGYYNYQYVVKHFDKKKSADHTLIEGDFSDTENDYYVLVYQKPIGGRYDKVVGYYFFKSVF